MTIGTSDHMLKILTLHIRFQIDLCRAGKAPVGSATQSIQYLIPFSQFLPLLRQLLQSSVCLLIHLSSAVKLSEFSLLQPLLFFLFFQLLFRLFKIRGFFFFQLASQPFHFLTAPAQLLFVGIYCFLPPLQLRRFHACFLKILFFFKKLFPPHLFISVLFFLFLLF